MVHVGAGVQRAGVIDTTWPAAPNGGFNFHDRGGPYGRTKGAKRVVAVDVTGLPEAAVVVRAPTQENRTSELMLEHMAQQGVTGRLGRSRRLAKSFENTTPRRPFWLQVAGREPEGGLKHGAEVAAQAASRWTMGVI